MEDPRPFKSLANELSKQFGGMPVLETSPENKNITAALSQFHGKTHSVTKRGKNVHFNARYALLGDVEDAVRGPLSECGLAYTVAVCPRIGDPIIYDVENAKGEIEKRIIERIRLYVVAELTHVSGEYRRFYGEFPVPHGPNLSQLIRATATYAKGTVITAMLSVSGGEEDDDGESLAEEPVRQSQRQENKKPPGPDPMSAAQRDTIRVMFKKLGVEEKDQSRWVTAQGLTPAGVHRDTAKADRLIEALREAATSAALDHAGSDRQDMEGYQ